MIVTVHDKDGDCFHINTEYVVLICDAKDFKDGEFSNCGLYMVWLVGVDIPVVLPEQAVDTLLKASNESRNMYPYGRGSNN